LATRGSVVDKSWRADSATGIEEEGSRW
jgi:hypothetical protein